MVEYQRRIIHGTEQIYNASGLSGNYPPVSVNQSGELILASGAYVITDIEIDVSSGLHVMISGQHVFVESGVHVIADVEVEVSSGQHVVVSGQPVTISGDHVYVESGVHVVSYSGGTIHTQTDVYAGGIQVSGAVQISGSIRTGMATNMSSSIISITGASGGQQVISTNNDRESVIIQNQGAADMHFKESTLQSGEGLKVASDGTWKSETYRGILWGIANSSGNNICVQEESL